MVSDAVMAVDFLKKIESESDVTRNDVCAKIDDLKRCLTSQAASLDQVILDGYTRVYSLGKGKYGFVDLVKDSETEEYFAVKGIQIVNETVPVEFAREVVILQDLCHDNILKLHKVVIRDNYAYLVMEYCGVSLNAIIQEGKDITAANTKKWMQQLLSGAAYAHARSIIHRDLKPENIMITDDHTVKIGDFGSAKSFLGLEQSPKVTTLQFRSPEALLGDPSYAAPSDIWSIGCIFYELVELKPLFNLEELSEIALINSIFKCFGTPTEGNYLLTLPNFPESATVYEAEFEITGELEDAGKDLLMQMLQLDPKRRITAQAALQHPYFGVNGDGNE